MEIDVSNNYERYKIINSSSTIDFLSKLQVIQSHIKSKLNENKYNKLYNKGIIQTITGINKIFKKYKLDNEDTSMFFNILQSELENTIPKFINYFTNEELEELFYSLLDFVNSINPSIRRISHNLLLDFKKLNLICFNSKREENVVEISDENEIIKK